MSSSTYKKSGIAQILGNVTRFFKREEQPTECATPEGNAVHKHKIGLSLAGGAALGYAHIGFLQAMEEAGIQPDCIVGTSMGAIMGMMYAAGYHPQQIKQIVKDEHMDRLTRLALPGIPKPGGLINTDRIQKILLKYVSHNSFDRLKTQYYCCSSNMNTLQPVYRGHGDQLVQYVMASAAMPAIFAPVSINGVYFVDGGVHDNLPIQPLLDEKCNIRIASQLVIEKPGRVKNPLLVWLHAFSYCSYATSFHNLEKFTDVVYIDPGIYWLEDFKHIDALYEIGYNAGKEYFGKKTITTKD